MHNEPRDNHPATWRRVATVGIGEDVPDFNEL